MPIFTGTAFTWSPATANTTSSILADFLSGGPLLVATLLEAVALVSDLAAAVLVPPDFAGSPFLGGLGGRVVTLASGTVSTLVRYSVSMSALTDMPGRKSSLSLSRMRTWNLVASCDWLLLLELLAVWLLSFDELATSVNTPANLRSLNPSTSSHAFWPGLMPTTSISPMSTRASIWFKSEMTRISVPANWAVPRTRSPSCEFNLLMVPSIGETIVVLISESCALSTSALATFTWSSALSSCARATSRADLKPIKSDSESSFWWNNSKLRA